MTDSSKHESLMCLLRNIAVKKPEFFIDFTSVWEYKNIDDVMRAQEDLVDIVHTLRQVVCVKG